MKESTLRRKLKKELGIGATEFKQLLEWGMPNDDGNFDEDEVTEWISNVLKPDETPPDVICFSVAQIAQHLGVTEPAVRGWMNTPRDEPFPEGPPWPAQAVADWRERNINVSRRGRPPIDGIASVPQDRVANLRADKLEHELRVKQGAYVEARVIQARVLRAAARQRAILRPLPDRLASELKRKGMNRKVQSDARKIAKQIVNDVCEQISRDLMEDTGEEDMATDDDS